MTRKICKWCGTEFQTNKNASLYCSVECSANAHRKNVSECKARFFEKQSEKKREQQIMQQSDEQERDEAFKLYVEDWKKMDVAKGGTGFLRSQELHRMKIQFNQRWQLEHPLPEISE